jgi:hypothetical protein
VDGDDVPRGALAIPAAAFWAIEISQPFDLGRRFDLLQCLEVAEHLPEMHSDTLIDNLCRHGDLIMFSAAIPGQGGDFHVWPDLAGVQSVLGVWRNVLVSPPQCR